MNYNGAVLYCNACTRGNHTASWRYNSAKGQCTSALYHVSISMFSPYWTLNVESCILFWILFTLPQVTSLHKQFRRYPAPAVMWVLMTWITSSPIHPLEYNKIHKKYNRCKFVLLQRRSWAIVTNRLPFKCVKNNAKRNYKRIKMKCKAKCRALILLHHFLPANLMPVMYAKEGCYKTQCTMQMYAKLKFVLFEAFQSLLAYNTLAIMSARNVWTPIQMST